MKRIFQTIKSIFTPNESEKIEAAKSESITAFNIIDNENCFYIAFQGVRVSTDGDVDELLPRLQKYREYYAAQLLTPKRSI